MNALVRLCLVFRIVSIETQAHRIESKVHKLNNTHSRPSQTSGRIDDKVIGTMTPSLPKQTSAWKKVRLLLWKNFLLQKRHWIQTAFDLFLPVLFTLLFVWDAQLENSSHKSTSDSNDCTDSLSNFTW